MSRETGTRTRGYIMKTLSLATRVDSRLIWRNEHPRGEDGRIRARWASRASRTPPLGDPRRPRRRLASEPSVVDKPPGNQRVDHQLSYDEEPAKQSSPTTTIGSGRAVTNSCHGAGGTESFRQSCCHAVARCENEAALMIRTLRKLCHEPRFMSVKSHSSKNFSGGSTLQFFH